jgi:hypothetical protein
MYVSGNINTWGATGMTYRNLVIPNWITTIQYTGITGNQGFKFRNSQDNWTENWGRGDAVTLGSKTIWYDNGDNGTFNHQNGNFYTFIFRDVNNTTHSDGMVIETNAIPVTIVSTYRIPTIVYQFQKPVVYATLSDDLPTGQGVYVRYTTNSWTSSAIHEMTAVNTTLYRYELPASDISTKLEYYFFTSGSGLTIPHADADLFTINLLNNSGSNYEYTVQAGTVRFSNAAANWSEASTWEGNSVPTSSDQVVIQHNVTLNENATVNSLLINKENTLTVNSTVNLTVNSELGNNNSLIINSDATSTGSLINSTTGVAATVQRYIPKYDNVNDNKYHFISSPVSAQPIFNDLTDFYRFSETNNYWINRTGNGIPEAFGDTEFVVGRGYLVANVDNITKEFSTGTLNTYPTTDSLVLTATHTDGQGNGWNLFGNPFPSAIDWNTVAKGDGMDNALYYYDASIENYRYYIQLPGETTITNDGGSRYIPAMQGFMVHAKSSGTKTITIDNDDRVHQAQTIFYKSNELASGVMSLKVNTDSFEDIAFIHFAEEATSGFDGAYDAYKLFSYNTEVPQMYTISANNESLAINGLPALTENLQIPVHFKVGKPGVQVLTADVSNIQSIVTLIDQFTSTSHNLTANPMYSFTSTEGDDPNRFLLHFGAVGVDEAVPTTAVSAYVHNNTLNLLNASGKVQVDVMDISGRLVHSQSLQTTGLSSTPLSLPAGVYVVRLNDGQTSRTDKVIVQ